MSFELDIQALLIVILLCLAYWQLWKLRSKFAVPKFFVSELKNLKTSSPSWKEKYGSKLDYLDFIALIIFIIALLDPHLQIPRKGPVQSNIPTQGIAIYIVADQSGSMNDKTSAQNLRIKGNITKEELLRKVSKDFVLGNPKENLQGRPNDLVGLIGFARTAHVLVPLTLNHEQVGKAIDDLQTVKNKDEDGTAMGYAIYKAATIMAATRHYAEDLSGIERPAYDIKSNVILLITDGFEEPNPLDENNPLRTIGLNEAAQYAKEMGVRIYIINVEPAFTMPEFLPHRHLLERITKETGGQFFAIQDATKLNEVYDALNTLQRSILPQTPESQLEIPKDQQPNRYHRVSIYPFLIALGMAVLFMSILLKTTVLRKAP